MDFNLTFYPRGRRLGQQLPHGFLQEGEILGIGLGAACAMAPDGGK